MTDFPELLTRYGKAVAEAPLHLHLTSESERSVFWDRHVMDSVHFAQFIDQKKTTKSISLLDVGTGNGAPGMVIAILHPEWQVDLLDSDTKKTLFLDTFREYNGMKNVQIITARAESLARTERREAYDVVVARALAKLPVALEFAGGFVKLGGYLIVSHGTSLEEQLTLSEKAMKAMGLEYLGAEPYWPEGSNNFKAAIFRKMSPTPERYPRNVGIPAKRPL